MLVLTWLLAGSVASAAGPPLERSIYGSATVTDAPGTTTIHVPDGSGGLRLRAALDPAKSYRLSIDGRSEADPINMRLSFDGRLDYRSSPQAREFVRVTSTTDFEVLLYSDRSAVYDLATAELEECAGTCGTEADLKALVLDETPGLAAALGADDHARAADLLLGWAAPRIPMGPTPLNTRPLSAAEIYFDYFRPLQRGVYCGGAASFFHKLLGVFDVPSFTVDFGTIVDALTHVTVVVSDDRPGAVRWRVADPTFSMTLGLAGAPGPVSLDQLLEAERIGLADRIEPALGDIADRTVVFVQGAGEDPQRVRCQPDSPYSVCSLAAYGRAFDPLLARNGFSAGLPGVLELFRSGELYFPEAHDLPADFVAMQERFRSAATRRDTTTVLAELPLRPILRGPARIADGSLERGELTLAELDWHPRAPVRAVTVRWERCAWDGGGCADTGARGAGYRPRPEDVGQRLRAVVTAANAFGRTTATSAPGGLVTDVPAADAQPTRLMESAPGVERAPVRLAPAGLSARTTRARATRAGLRYTTAGRLAVTRGTTSRAACGSGSVSVRVVRGAATISRRTVPLRRDCSYRSSVVFRDRARLGRGRLRVVARFTGNDVLQARSAPSQLVPGLLDDGA